MAPLLERPPPPEAWPAPPGEGQGGVALAPAPPLEEVEPVPVSSGGESLRLAHLCHSVTAGAEEKLLITLSDIRFDAHSHISTGDLRIKAYVGPVSVVDVPGRPDKHRLTEVRLDLHEGLAVAEIHCGVPHPAEPWCLRTKLYHRPASALFRQEQVAEVAEPTPGGGQGPPRAPVTWLAVPRPTAQVQLIASEHHAQVGSATLRVLRCVPPAARERLAASTSEVLIRAVRAGVCLEEVEELCRGARELGPGALEHPGAAEALDVAANMGNMAVVGVLLRAGVRASMDSVRRAEKAGQLDLAMRIFTHLAGDTSRPMLARALAERLPDVAERLVKDDPDALDDLPADGGSAAKMAHSAMAWTVLAMLIGRGDPLPAPPRQLLDYALRAGHAGLARVLLSHNEGFEDMEKSLRTCLENGRVEIVREALEAQWRVRASLWSDSTGPPLLSLECGPADEPAECGVCFDSLHVNPGVFVGAQGFRVCPHFICLDCAEHVQDEAVARHQRWRQRNDRRFPEPPGPVCPLCRAPFKSAVRLKEPTVDPRSFFRLACVPDDREHGGGGEDVAERRAEDLRLKRNIALGALTALLPVNPNTFAAKLEGELWPAWLQEARAHGEALQEDDFLRPGGMLAWVCDHLLEIKVSEARGAPPRLEDNPTAWFHHFDFDGKGALSRAELLRGIAKAYDVAALASPTTPARRKRTVGVQRLREIVEAVWDDVLWADGVPLAQFEGPRGLADKLVDVLPGDHRGREKPADGTVVEEQPALSVEEALSRARESDFERIAEDEARQREREEKKQKAEQGLPARPGVGPRQGGAPGARPPEQGVPPPPSFQDRPGGHRLRRDGGELLFMSGVAQRQGGHRTESARIRIQCPHCRAVNEVTAAAGYRVICGQCRGAFAVPHFQGAPGRRP